MSEDKTFRSGFAALLGRPNVGKSSIINALLKEKVAAVSPKPQTTRNAVRCIYTAEGEQIVFVDTPGIHVPKHALGDFMMKEAEESLMLVDAVCYVVEAQDRAVSEKDEIILKVLENVAQPVVLAVNKTDKLDKFEDYKKAAAVYEKYISPAAVVPVSANNGRGLPELAAAISALLPEQPPIYPEDMLMDSTERFLASEVIREKIFRHTDEEVPHGVAVGFGQAGEVAKLHGDEGRVRQRELHVPADECLQHRVRTCCRRLVSSALTLRQQPFADADQHLAEQCLLAGEVLVEGGARDTQGSAEVIDRDAVKAALGELGRGHRQDLFPARCARAGLAAAAA